MLNKLVFLTVLLTALFLAGSAFSADEYHRTPYGDYCITCTTYGICDTFVPEKESREAIRRYYGKRNLEVGNMKFRGRFIEFEIRKNGEILDKALFDRKTGRIRSIY